MKRLLGIALISFVVFAACEQQTAETSGTDEFEVAEKPLFAAAGGGLLMRISDPDEAFSTIEAYAGDANWSSYLDPATALDTDSEFATGFLLGVRSTNALLHAALGDWETAEAISESVRLAAERLDIQTDDVEALIQDVIGAFEEEDEQLREIAVSRSVNALRGTIIRTLNTLDEEEIALAIELGAWLEASRQAAGITRDAYSEELSVVLLRGSEAQYFLETLQRIGIQKEMQDELEAVIEPIRTVSAIMNSPVATPDAVQELYDNLETARAAALEA